jgi:hypothetical protein
MEILSDLLKILIPAALVLYVMFATVKLFLGQQFDLKKTEIKQKNTELITPLRLQAYERMTLFLERITPNNLLVRTNGMGIQVLDYQQVILSEIREEYTHNLSQQIYMSHEAWEKIKVAMNNVTALINTSANEVLSDAPALDLSKKIFEKVIQFNLPTTDEALKFLKEEVQEMYV